MTSNRPLEDWGKLLGDVPSATAILDRFLHHAEIIQITGRSYRLRNRAKDGPSPEGENGSNAASAHGAETAAEKASGSSNAASAHATETAAEKAPGGPNAAKAPMGRSAGSTSRKKAAG
jgi:hypothetical protein